MSDNKLIQRATLGGIVVDVPVCSDAQHCESVRRKYAATGGAVDLVRMVREGIHNGTEKQAKWFARSALKRLEAHAKARSIPPAELELVREYIKAPALKRTSRAVAASKPAERLELSRGALTDTLHVAGPGAGDKAATEAARWALATRVQRASERRAKRAESRGGVLERRADAVDQLEQRADDLDELEDKLTKKSRELEAGLKALETNTSTLGSVKREQDERAAKLDARAAELEKREKALTEKPALTEKGAKK